MGPCASACARRISVPRTERRLERLYIDVRNDVLPRRVIPCRAGLKCVVATTEPNLHRLRRNCAFHHVEVTAVACPIGQQVPLYRLVGLHTHHPPRVVCRFREHARSCPRTPAKLQHGMRWGDECAYDDPYVPLHGAIGRSRERFARYVVTIRSKPKTPTRLAEAVALARWRSRWEPIVLRRAHKLDR